jgi:hypothetical protein
MIRADSKREDQDDLLDDRACLRQMLCGGEYAEALRFFKEHHVFSKVYETDIQVRATFDCLLFLQAIKDGNLASAIKLT